MVCDVGEYYNIVEPFDRDDDVGSYLFQNKIRYHMRTSTKIDFEIDLAWMASAKPTTFVVYTVMLTEEEILYLKLRFPDLTVDKPKSPEKIADMAKRVLL